MNLVVSSALLALLLVPDVLGLFMSKHILCNQSIPVPAIDRSLATAQTISLTLCNFTFKAAIYPNERLLSRNASVDARLSTPTTRRFAYLGHLLTEDRSSVSVILYPQLQIYLYLNGTYYYYLSLSWNNSVTLRFSQRQLLQYYPQLVNDSLWSKLQLEEDIYQQNSMILHDLHFIYELLTLRCDGDGVLQQTVSFCSLALFVDRLLFEKAFQANVYHLFTIIEHFNFLLRTLTVNEYGGFLVERLTLVDHVRTNFNSSFDLLHTLANNVTYALKNYCLAHQMLLADGEKDNYVLGYQSSINTYDVGGICSSPFNVNNNQSEEMNLNTGLSMFNENFTANMSMFFNGLMKTSYLFFRQMGLNLTLCSINATRRGFFQFNTQLAPAVQNCAELLPTTLLPALKRRAHLCFTAMGVQNWSSQAVQHQLPCQRSLELQSAVPVDGKNAKNSRLESIVSDNRRSEWMEGNIVGMIITFSLIVWIPVSCFVHFCKDEINKKAFLEKQQQQELEALQMKSSLAEQTRSAKQTQTD